MFSSRYNSYENILDIVLDIPTYVVCDTVEVCCNNQKSSRLELRIFDLGPRDNSDPWLKRISNLHVYQVLIEAKVRVTREDAHLIDHVPY